MPELPEVEVIARGLRETLPGLAFEAVQVFDLRAVPGHTPEEFISRCQGRAVGAVRRRGKLLLLELRGLAQDQALDHAPHDAQLNVSEYMDGHAPEFLLTVHLRMTGRVVHGPDRPTEAHERIRFSMSDGSVLTFADVRRFGGCRVFTPQELEQWTFFAVLGPEPLEMDSKEFLARFAGRKARIKGLLLDQRVIAGVGNIYADESLFRAGIRPDARADAVSRPRLKRLHTALQEVLRQAIAENGSSISDYRNARGDAGAFQNSFQVYGKVGEACLRCGRTLCGCRIAGRSSTYCTKCQQL